MASQKQIFLVALLFAVALGCHVGRLSAKPKCHSSGECTKLCFGGTAQCVDGRCVCPGADAEVAQKNTKCKSDVDCARVINFCRPSCNMHCAAGGICSCAC